MAHKVILSLNTDFSVTGVTPGVNFLERRLSYPDLFFDSASDCVIPEYSQRDHKHSDQNNQIVSLKAGLRATTWTRGYIPKTGRFDPGSAG